MEAGIEFEVVNGRHFRHCCTGIMPDPGDPPEFYSTLAVITGNEDSTGKTRTQPDKIATAVPGVSMGMANLPAIVRRPGKTRPPPKPRWRW